MENKINIRDVVMHLGLDCDTTKGQVYIACPECAKNANQKKLNINFGKDVFRCNKCGRSGGPIALWGLYRHIADSKEAFKDYMKTIESGKPAAVRVSTPKKEPVPDVPSAEISVLDATYNALIRECSLSKAHLDSLKKRGLSEETILRNQYRSYPLHSLEKLAQKIQKENGCILQGIPGFYVNDKNIWQIREFKSGILIPQRNGKNQIQGFQIRFDEAGKDSPRYISLSTRDMKSGAPSHTYCHFRPGEKGCSKVILTEGALKADVISELSGYSVLAVPGVNSRSYLGDALESLKNYGLQEVLLAFDMDRNENVYVKKALENTEKEIEAAGFNYTVLCWDPAYKGLDDYLLAKKTSLTK